MTVVDLFNLGNKYQNEGNIQLAMNMWQECVKMDQNFSPAYINMFNNHRSSNNLKAAKECLDKFSNCPLTMNTLELVPQVKKELADIEKQLNPQSNEKK